MIRQCTLEESDVRYLGIVPSGQDRVIYWRTFICLMQCGLSYSIAERNLIRIRIGSSVRSKRLSAVLKCDAIQDVIALLM